MHTLFNRASALIKARFGTRIQKVAIDAGFSCPNLDGKLSDQGCLYCNNKSFAPFYSNPQLSIGEQLHAGCKYYATRYGGHRFFAYFQSHSCTYAPIEELRGKYCEAAACEGIVGLVIATRPDCISPEIIELLQELSAATFVRIELGVESFDDQVLCTINRCHDRAEALNAINLLKSAGIPVCIHLISGLPGEKPDQMIEAAKITSNSGADMVKLHHLQIVKGSRLAELYLANPDRYHLHSLDEYLNRVCDFISYLAPEIYLDRFINRVPLNQLIAPIFNGVDEASFQRLLENRLQELSLYQGAKITASL